MLPLLRPVEMDQHPMMRQTYTLPTVSIDEAYTEVKRCIRHRIPGALRVGQSRCGKTYCTLYISRLLKENIPKLVVQREAVGARPDTTRVLHRCIGHLGTPAPAA